MTKIISIILVSLFLTGLLFSSSVETAFVHNNDLQLVQYQPGIFTPNNSREDIVIFSENFENGIPATWTTEDVTNPGSYWYTSQFNAFDSLSWRMADPGIGANGGYLDSWYQVLDTPVITLPSSGSLVLSFEQFRAIEEPDDYLNFDGWDGFNVRIRLANQFYEEAEILTDCNPAYNSASLYSFGAIHLEDIDGEPGIPGWAGSIDWTHTTVDIPSTYAGQDIIISFAFASDEATSTSTNPEFTGISLDDIDVAGVFFNNGSSTEGFTGVTNTDIGGDLWHVLAAVNAPSPVYVLGCFDADSLKYNPNMENYLTTKTYYLPTGTNYSLDFMLKTALDDESFPNCDYFSVEVKYSTMGIWSNWNSISNPTGDPNIENIVFTGSVSEWTHFSSGWIGYNDISILAGHLVQFRIGMHSNNDAPDSFGIMLDDFQIIETSYPGTPPTNLMGELLSDHSVLLSWEPPANETVLSYRIYSKVIDDVEFEFISVAMDTIYVHNDATASSNNYYVVSAILDTGETDLCELIDVYVPDESASVVCNDDGSSESSINVGIMNSMATYFEPASTSETSALTHIIFYIEELNSGPVSLTVWEAVNGLPSAKFQDFPISVPNSNLHNGWNTLAIPADIQPTIAMAPFFVGINDFVNNSAIGFDTDNAGYSYTNVGGWQQLDSGNIMVRAIINDVPIIQEPSPDPTCPKLAEISNFPNPFNPETTISLNLNESERVIVQVFNLKGQLVKTLLDERLPAGISQIKWTGRDADNKAVASGIYFYKIITNKEKKSGKMLLLK